MPNYLFQYEMIPTTWFFLSALIILAIFFKFNRFFSVRNLDIVALLFLTPGLLLIAMSFDASGYVLIFAMSCYFTFRCLFDIIMVRRPLLEPNLSLGGLTFACVALMSFQVANVSINRGERIEDIRTLRLEQILTLRGETIRGTGFQSFYTLAENANQVIAPSAELKSVMQEHQNKIRGVQNGDANWEMPMIATKPEKRGAALPIVLIIMAHWLIATGLIAVCYFHFDNFQTGIAAAVLQQLLPYTSQFPGRLDHLIPGALLVWAIVFYRRPFFSGLCIGTAACLVFYPVFLIPLWIGFFWSRGYKRFLVGTAISIAITYIVCTFIITDATFGWAQLRTEVSSGFWSEFPGLSFYRFPVIAGFLVLTFGLMIWPSHKNLATLLSGTAIIMLTCQLWQPFQGGLSMAWHLPILILVILRPNLEDRIAVSTVIGMKN